MITKQLRILGILLIVISCKNYRQNEIAKISSFEYLLNNDSLIVLDINSKSTISDLIAQYCNKICKNAIVSENYCLKYDLCNNKFQFDETKQSFIKLEFCGFKCNTTISDLFANEIVFKPFKNIPNDNDLLFNEVNPTLVKQHFIRSINMQKLPLFIIKVPPNFKISNCNCIMYSIISGYKELVNDISTATYNKKFNRIQQDSFFTKIKQKYPLLISFKIDYPDVYCQ